jgi:hypothetical protein
LCIVVLEIWPVTGNLTTRLLASHSARIVTVEIGQRLVEAVTAREEKAGASSGSLHYVCGEVGRGCHIRMEEDAVAELETEEEVLTTSYAILLLFMLVIERFYAFSLLV